VDRRRETEGGATNTAMDHPRAHDNGLSRGSEERGTVVRYGVSGPEFRVKKKPPQRGEPQIPGTAFTLRLQFKAGKCNEPDLP